MQYLYHDDSEIHVMDPENYEQHTVPLEAMQGGDKALTFCSGTHV
jgi:elongation factor P